MMCDVPFLGEAFFNPNGSFTVLSLGLLRRNIHVWIEPKGVLEADIHFIPFAYVLKARWRSDDVMGANGAELFNLWETHPYSKGLPEGYNPGLARREYLMSLPEGRSKASKRALDDCNSWIARASSSRGSPTSQLELFHTRPTVEMIDSASMYSAQTSGNAARARSESRSDNESEQDQHDYPEGADQGLREIIFHNFQHKVDEAPMLVEIAMDGAQWWPDSCKLKYTDPIHAGDLVRARVGVMNSWREPCRPLLDVEKLGDRAEEEVAAKNRRLYDFVTHFMRKDRREVEEWQSEYLRREETDATKLRNRKELRSSARESTNSRGSKKSKIFRSTILGWKQLLEDAKFLMATLDTTPADSSEQGIREASLPSSFEQQFDEDHVESEDNIATGKPSSVIVSKPLLRAADAVKTMQRNLRYPSSDHIIRSR